METNSIRQLKEQLEQLSKNLSEYKDYHRNCGTDINAYKYGSENQYSIRTIIEGIQDIQTTISYLVRAHNIYLKISSFQERNDVVSYLSNLNYYLSNTSDAYIIENLEILKQKLRFFNIRIEKDKLSELYTEVQNLRISANKLDDDIALVKRLLADTKNIISEIHETQKTANETLTEIQTQKDSLVKEYNDFVSKYSDLKDLTEKAEKNEATIDEYFQTILNEKITFDEFVRKISDRESQLNGIQSRSDEFENQLQSYANEQALKMQEADRLIAEAKQALNYKNAEGLSAAFSTQLVSAKSKKNTAGWILGALAFIILTLAIGVWIILGWGLEHNVDRNQMIFNLVGRLSMIPFTIIAAVFCANQYTKQKNIIEDYAYKTTIAKSIIAFSEELRDKEPEKYAEYISTILKEIHQDPLRKRDKGSSDFKLTKESSGLIEKVIELLQSAISKS